MKFRQIPFRIGRRTVRCSGHPPPPPLCCARLCCHATSRVVGPDDLVHQAEPFASFDAVNQRRHHALRPDRGFHPPPFPARVARLCPLLSRLRHCRGCLLAPFRTSRIHLPASLPSDGFASRPSPPPVAAAGTMKALTPAGLTLTGRSLRLLRLAFPAFRPQPRDLPAGRFHQSPQRQRLFPGFATNEQARHSSHAETGSSSYGLPVRLRLLPTPPRGDAVTFNFGAATALRHGLAPC